MSKATFRVDLVMFAPAKSAKGTQRVLIGGDFHVWLESLANKQPGES